MVFSFLKGQFIDVIEWTDDTRDTMVYRFERYGNAINYGAKLTVREGQAAVFVHEGQMADVFGPGLYMLETDNMPVMTALQHWDHLFQSPFKSEIYFVNTRRFPGLKWGTQNPIMLRDPEFGPVRLRAFGSYTIRVTEPARFMTEIVGTDGEFTEDEIAGQIRNIVVQKASRVLAASGIPALDMAANTKDLGEVIGRAIEPTLTEYGLSMPELYIENISLPAAVEKVLDQRTSMGIVGDLNKYTQFSAAQAMQNAAGEGGDGGMGAGMGAGLGMGVGMGMAQTMANAMGANTAGAATGTPPPPPPPPAEKVWHIAENGQTKGPFARANLGQMIIEGSFTRATLVWTPGQDGWIAAGDISELAQLFTVAPPPPPPV
ncbi:Membrane protease subunit, stomatin/prohibitin family, contains C-terminal Zn-ribbon domain [Roseicitreum antarcticum]|uniref:Membrane protease subunit, stomatin/prohibitin family, contains C-terminal Zn-ribbon domain n=2 Tax=Roseicitreum antarcticum TaxID=564137 RepID=A0A1H2U4G9_9RHOB|nr:Membrane protease subunit, stomatin/prohibitin family, contains C-terminal Zn-ribbon domain [Roseicitreum antarcticum]